MATAPITTCCYSPRAVVRLVGVLTIAALLTPAAAASRFTSVLLASTHAGRRLQASFDHESHPTIDDDEIVFFQHSEFRGRSRTFQLGDYVSLGRDDGDFSSVRVGSQVYAEVFEYTHFRGDFTDVVIDVPRMGGRGGWNDAISSLKVKRRPQNAVALFVDVTSEGSTFATLNGRRTVSKFVTSPADLTLSGLRGLGLRNDDLSEIHIPRGFTAILYKHDYFSGPSVLLSGPTATRFDNGDIKFSDQSQLDDEVSSLRLRSVADVFNNGKVGRWTVVKMHDYAFTHTVTEEYLSEESSTSSSTVTASLEQGFEFEIGPINITISQSAAYLVTQEVSQLIGRTETTKTTITMCNIPCYIGEEGELRSLYLFRLELQREGIRTYVNPCIFMCLPSYLEPQCPPGNCKDRRCQTCLDEDEAQDNALVARSISETLVEPDMVIVSEGN
uniref:Beta/gamma crystallin 'Greek key' domain-containing protein n=1 Tax=Tetraselmis chuii TaxID=63592 RepID=A0A7S1X5R6_9CHLO|mmetsp:Transcript_31892/g.57080  ORF Transcript_31892/g.57080 Transcript_31892/m.57080 type:complete len:444 (+) Transcript_31892:400-1731(+)|eukprot:CAMPEP_0177758132 /NCGR_PEP_ID=MMETSP0491_2-20121128/4024_1 /TAXON_ID=63592 /ORGANISM="Tetraselmis chuii, Strain PLY429" /LENGTH=443 /DNA_ID=CAMNT_0019273851 /DNA_START=366 /DNA_END=1697 /DNA_ORIENTATION=+